jgi:hypothetical protein
LAAAHATTQPNIQLKLNSRRILGEQDKVAHMDKKTKITTANGFAYLSKNQFVVFLEARLMQYDLVITVNNSNKEPIIISRS